MPISQGIGRGTLGKREGGSGVRVQVVEPPQVLRIEVTCEEGRLVTVSPGGGQASVEGPGRYEPEVGLGEHWSTRRPELLPHERPQAVGPEEEADLASPPVERVCHRFEPSPVLRKLRHGLLSDLRADD